MKFITEQYVRNMLKEKKLVEFHVAHNQILTPAAKDYLDHMNIRVCFDQMEPEEEHINVGRYVDTETGKKYDSKPEFMTHLFGDKLVYKDNNRIVFRGELDCLQSLIVYVQTILVSRYPETLVRELEGVLAFIRNLTRAEVLDEPVGDERLLDLDSEDLRYQSHHPDSCFGIEAMTPPHYEMGKAFALVNMLRSQSRQVEVAAVRAFRDGHTVSRQDIILALNRLSSAFHILCCRLISGHYDTSERWE